jgi:hypothetical protein
MLADAPVTRATFPVNIIVPIPQACHNPGWRHLSRKLIA